MGSGNSSAGGNVGVLAGASDAGTGGSVTLYSGKGTMSSSGSLVIRTLDAGTKGLSGMLSLLRCGDERVVGIPPPRKIFLSRRIKQPLYPSLPTQENIWQSKELH